MLGIKNKILLVTLLPLCLVLVVISGLTISNKLDTERQLLFQRLNSYRTLLESGDLNFDSSKDKKKLEQILNEKVVFAEILDSNLSVIYSTENSAAPLITSEEKKDVIDAFNGIETTKNFTYEGRSAFGIISPLVVNGSVVAVLHQALSNEFSSQRVIQYILFVFTLALFGMGICYVLITLLLYKVILKNLYTLKYAAMKIQQGDLSTPILVTSNDEIGEFAKNFDNMRSQINDAQQKLELYNKQLQGLVQSRTLELESKVIELEHLNKLMVDRELKMVELKNKLKEFGQEI